ENASSALKRESRVGGPVAQGSGFCLLVSGEHVFSTNWLPESGDVTIGRASTCDIQIDEGSVSPLHAVIHLDREPRIEDLDSDSGTQVGEARILPRQPVNLVPGELIKLGAVMLIFQKRMNARPRRIWTHGYFESRLEEECTRADFYHKDFALLRLHFDRA